MQTQAAPFHVTRLPKVGARYPLLAKCLGAAARFAALSAVLFQVACGGGGGGDSSVAPQAPSISAQPSSTTAVNGTSVTFSITATGDGLIYQWQRSIDSAVTWDNIVGATASAYTLTVSSALDGYQYRAVVSGTAGSVTSSPVTLSVAPAPIAPAITVQPSSQTVIAGTPTTFSVTATGTSLTYQWQFSLDGGSFWVTIGPETSPTFKTSTSINDNGKQFRVIVSNSLGSVNSSAATLTVLTAAPLPTIITQPVAASVTAPQTATFSVVATSSLALSYQWQQSAAGGASFTDIASATSAGYTTPVTVLSDNGRLFRVRVSNASGSVLSSSVALSVAAAPSAPKITLPPIGVDVAPGTVVTFTAASTGNPTPTLQWQQSIDGPFTNINGATGTQLTILATPYISGSDYRVVATNVMGEATSDSANLVVYAPSTIGAHPNGLAIDASGNKYVVVVTEDLRGVRKVDPNGVVSFLAGGPETQDRDGVSTFARFITPTAAALDGAGNLYVADAGSIRKVAPDGTVSTFAGSTQQGYLDGVGTAAQFFNPRAIAVDSSGTLYVADARNCAIRKITPAGVVSTLAGGRANHVCVHADGTGSAASFSIPSGIAVDGSGNLYVTDQGTSSIRKVTAAGQVTTLAGGAGDPNPGGFVDGVGTAARLNQPYGIVVDAAGNLYVADVFNHAIRKVTPAGVVSTFVGGKAGYAEGTGTAAKFVTLKDLAIDGSGNIFATDWSLSFVALRYDVIRKITPAGVVTTVVY